MKLLYFFLSIALLATSAIAAPIQFTDDFGNKLSFDSIPKRIIILNSSNLELFYAAGGTPIAYAKSSTMPQYLRDKLQNIPSVGKVQSPDLEKIVSLKPDLVIGMNFPFHTALQSTFKAAEIPMAQFSINGYNDLIEKMKIFGQLTGKPEKAKAILENIAKDMEQVNTALKGINKKKVLVLFGSPESFNMALPASFVGKILEMAKGINIAQSGSKGGRGMFSGFAPVSLETVMMEDPAMIFIISHENKISSTADNMLLKQPAWKALTAVQNGKVIKLPFETYGINPTIRLGSAVLELAKQMYPEKF